MSGGQTGRDFGKREAKIRDVKRNPIRGTFKEGSLIGLAADEADLSGKLMSGWK